MVVGGGVVVAITGVAVALGGVAVRHSPESVNVPALSPNIRYPPAEIAFHEYFPFGNGYLPHSSNAFETPVSEEI